MALHCIINSKYKFLNCFQIKTFILYNIKFIKGTLLWKDKNNYQIMCGQILNFRPKLFIGPTPKPKSYITYFFSTPSITYCCHYSAAMVFRAVLLKQFCQSSHNEKKIMLSGNSPSSCVIIWPQGVDIKCHLLKFYNNNTQQGALQVIALNHRSNNRNKQLNNNNKLTWRNLKMGTCQIKYSFILITTLLR